MAKRANRIARRKANADRKAQAAEPQTRKLLVNQPVEKLNQLARDIEGNLVFTDRQVSQPDLIGNVFMILLFMSKAERQEMIEGGARMVYEYYSQSCPRSINGMPMFLSARFLNEHDTDYVWARVKQIREAINAVAPTQIDESLASV